MASVIATDGKCVQCGACVEVCPAKAIKDCGTQMVVNPDVCIDCGICIGECPNGAIVNDSEVDQKWIDFNKKESQK